MTAEPDLLPLLPLGECSEDSVREWCRANVAHFTAPLQAEIEALREEVERAQYAAGRWENVAKSQASWELLWSEEKARAERLTEALRQIAKYKGNPNTPVRNSVEKSAIARAALKQEAGRG